MTNNEPRIAELTACIVKATENRDRAVKLGMRTLAQMCRRDLRAYRAELADLVRA